MSYRKENIRQTVDWITVLLYVILITAGWFSICGASYEYEGFSWFDPAGRPGSHLIRIALSLGLIFVILMLDADFFHAFANFIYVALILLLVATVFLAPEIKGSRSWLVMGPLRVQPAEFAKFATALCVAKFAGSYGFKTTAPKNFLTLLFIITLPMACILMQNETGSALVFLAFFLVFYREGMTGFVVLSALCAVAFFVIGMKYSGSFISGGTPLGELLVLSLIHILMIILTGVVKKDLRPVKILAAATAAVAALTVAVHFFFPFNLVWVAIAAIAAASAYIIYYAFKTWVWRYLLIPLCALAAIGYLYSVDYVFNNVLEAHQQLRIKVALGLENDPGGAGYNVNQSEIAIGSGGLTGKGFLNGTQTKLKYVPEQDTDFIFCTIGEEQGFWGASAILILFAALILRIIYLAEKQKTDFARIYGYGVASLLFFHFVINIGMVTGLTPVIGIPLPFFSYGGSALWGFTILLFIFLRLDVARKAR